MSETTELPSLQQQIDAAYPRLTHSEIRVVTVRVAIGISANGSNRMPTTWLLHDDKDLLDDVGKHNDLDIALEGRFFTSCDICNDYHHRDQLKSLGPELLCEKCWREESLVAGDAIRKLQE